MAADETPVAAVERDWSPGTPHPARVYDYLLGGKDHDPADVAAAENMTKVFPAMPIAARVNRAFMRRAVRWLAAEMGIRQFLDIGSGIPTAPNLHQVVQAVAPEARVVYVDHDPVVRACAQTLLTSTPEGRVAYVEADATEPESLLAAPELRDTLDLSQPVALMMIAMLHFIPDHRDAYGIVERLLSALPSGSALVISHMTADFAPEAMRITGEILRRGGTELHPRSRPEIARFFSGLELVEPGIDVPHHWRSDGEEAAAQREFAELGDADAALWAGVALKP